MRSIWMKSPAFVASQRVQEQLSDIRVDLQTLLQHLDVPLTVLVAPQLTPVENSSGVTRCGGHDVMTAGNHTKFNR